MKNTPGKPPVTPKEISAVLAENKQLVTPPEPTNQQSDEVKASDETKEVEAKLKETLHNDSKKPGAQNGEAVEKLGIKKAEVCELHVSSEANKKQQTDALKLGLVLEKELPKDKSELSKASPLEEVKKPVVSSDSFGTRDGSPRAKGNEVSAPPKLVESAKSAPPAQTAKPSVPKAQDPVADGNARETKPEETKLEETPPVKQGVRGVLRMANLNGLTETLGKQPQGADDTEKQGNITDSKNEDVKPLRKDESPVKDPPSLKPVLLGGSTTLPGVAAAAASEKKTVKFAEPLNEAGEIKVLVNPAKNLPGTDGKREILAPPTLGKLLIGLVKSQQVLECVNMSHPNRINSSCFCYQVIALNCK